MNYVTTTASIFFYVLLELCCLFQLGNASGILFFFFGIGNSYININRNNASSQRCTVRCFVLCFASPPNSECIVETQLFVSLVLERF